MPAIRCPFWPTCEAELSPIEQRRDAKTTDTEFVYPQHIIVGPESWYGICPASFFLITYVSWAPGYELTDDAKRVLADAGTRHSQMLVRRLTAEASKQAAPVDPRLREKLDAFAAGDDQAFQRGRAPLTNPDRPKRPHDEHFPGRPADAPEPGPGDAPANRVPLDLGGGALGKAAMDDARNNLKAMTTLAIGQMEQTQDLLARLQEAIQTAEGLTVAAEHQARSAQALVTAAVGSGSGMPPSAEGMAEQVTLAVSTIGDQGDGILPALRLAHRRVRDAFVQLGSAIENAKTYRNIP